VRGTVVYYMFMLKYDEWCVIKLCGVRERAYVRAESNTDQQQK